MYGRLDSFHSAATWWNDSDIGFFAVKIRFLIHSREHPSAPDGPPRPHAVREAPSQPRLTNTHPLQKALYGTSPFASVFHLTTSGSC